MFQYVSDIICILIFAANFNLISLEHILKMLLHFFIFDTK